METAPHGVLGHPCLWEVTATWNLASVGKRLPHLHFPPEAEGHGDTLSSRNPQQMLQSLAVLLWGGKGKQAQTSQEPEERKSQRPHPVCLSVFNSFKAISASPPSASYWKVLPPAVPGNPLFLWLNESHSQPEPSCSHSRDAPGFPPPSQPSWVYLWSMTEVPLALALSGCSSQFLGLLSENIPATRLLSLGFILPNVGDQPWRWSLRDGCVTNPSTQQNSFLTPLETLRHPRMVGWG